MPAQKHLKRLARVWQEEPVYFITTCVAQRRPLLALESIHQIVRDEFRVLNKRHGWSVGSYVLMPDHVHFFVKPIAGKAKPLNFSIGSWKEWTAKRALRILDMGAPLWQSEFFDHVLRSADSRRQKWNYMMQNPVRVGLVSEPQNWPFKGRVEF